ncbi:MAG: hypothetical protein ACREDM_05665 [Methylocella sp.]
MVLTVLTSSPGFAAAEFCWRDSDPRGVGTVPQACEAGRDRIGLLCYSQCGPNMQRFGFDCHSVCPSGLRDDGLFCRAAEYGRGAGYPWKFGDSLNDNGMFRRCETDQGKGNCEKNGLIVYPKCKPGYSNFGCCICRPSVPDCGKLGLNPGIDLSCAKKVKIGDPVLGVCGSGEDRDVGLCYRACKPGFAGVGPVCWGQAPKGWVECGMGASKNSTTCASVVFGQVAAVGQLAMTAATLGTSMAATTAVNAPAQAGKLAQLRGMYDKLKTAYEAAKKATPALQTAENGLNALATAKKGATAFSTATNAVTAEDIARLSAQIAAIVDSSGVSSAVGAYTYPKCSKYFGTP